MVIFTEHLTYHKPEKCIYTLKKTISEELKNTDIQSTLKVSAAITLKIYIYIYKKKKSQHLTFCNCEIPQQACQSESIHSIF